MSLQQASAFQTISSQAVVGAPPPRGADARCFTVMVDGRTYGIAVESIHTVFEIVAVTPVPLAPYQILGLVNLRAKIAAVHRLDDLILPILDLDWILTFDKD